MFQPGAETDLVIRFSTVSFIADYPLHEVGRKTLNRNVNDSRSR